MVNKRWIYQVVEIKPGFRGLKVDAVQERLTQLGAQGWELVSATHPHTFQSVTLFLKKEA